ncbi:MAG: amidohydrolase [Clostridiales Family XIII bacterium]|jgi:hippurate hydrolase|nr:amidohydrolase [Clostridiales Family XIII bacterium]
MKPLKELNHINKELSHTNREKLIAYRRDLHRIPELGHDLPKTAKYIVDHLSALPCEIISVSDGGFCALFKGGKAAANAPATAFRTDMDALPITEENDVDYRSQHEGAMHACGHDGHMSIMLGFAEEVAAGLGGLDRNVLLVFQPAEETTGGAKDIAESGVFTDHHVEKIFGLHLWPGFPTGSVICRDGDFMASTMVLYVDIEGKSAHIGQYKKGIDALDAACRFVTRCYVVEKDEVAPEVRRLLRFGLLRSGSANNIVADSAHLEGTLRTYADEVSGFLLARIDEIAAGIGARTGAKLTIRHTDPYPAVVNPHRLFAASKKALTKEGFDFIELPDPLMISEDFSWYQRALPGLFLYIGTGADTPLHSPAYRMDEDALVAGVLAYKTLLGA